jgi:hypothetical protein
MIKIHNLLWTWGNDILYIEVNTQRSLSPQCFFFSLLHDTVLKICGVIDVRDEICDVMSKILLFIVWIKKHCFLTIRKRPWNDTEKLLLFEWFQLIYSKQNLLRPSGILRSLLRVNCTGVPSFAWTNQALHPPRIFWNYLDHVFKKFQALSIDQEGML